MTTNIDPKSSMRSLCQLGSSKHLSFDSQILFVCEQQQENNIVSRKTSPNRNVKPQHAAIGILMKLVALVILGMMSAQTSLVIYLADLPFRITTAYEMHF